MGNAATKETLIPPAIVTTSTKEQISRFDSQIEKECHRRQQQSNDEDLSTVQTDGSASGYVVTIADNNINIGDKNATIAKQDSPRQSVTLVSVENGLYSGEDYDSVVSGITLNESVTPSNAHAVRWWDGQKFFSDYVQDGVRSLRNKYDDDVDDDEETKNICMVFENPSTSQQEATYFNGNTFKFHEFPPSPPLYKAVLTPCRYSMMNGNAYPSYLQGGVPPTGLMEHWNATIPGFVNPVFVPDIPTDAKVFAYLPMESISNYVNNPHVHYHLCGKDALHLMTKNTPQLLANTQIRRPCICKTTHSMAGKGIFIIRNDQDEQEYETFIAETGNPTYVVTEFVDIERNVACHFFIHPNRDGITWFGSNENCRMEDGSWSPDSTIIKQDQEHLREIQLPFVQDVVSYFQSLGFWGFCGVDVLFDKSGKGYLVDVNPRVTGSLPAIMVGHILYRQYGYEYCLFRRSARYAYKGTAVSFIQKVDDYNEANAGNSIIVVNSFAEESETRTLVQFGVYGNNGLEACQEVLDEFAPINKAWKGED